MILVFAVTGLRTSECRGLRWCNFDAANSLLSVTHGLGRKGLSTPKSKGSERTIALPQLVSQYLQAWRGSSPFSQDDDFIFCWPDGHPYSDTYLRVYVLYPALKRAGIEIVPRQRAFHMFRHTLASQVWERTGNAKAVQELLGHANITTTMNIYVHLDEQSKAGAVLPVSSEIAAAVEWPEIASEIAN